jgi:hypothetical protein
MVVHTYNPSDSGGRDQADHGFNPAWANRSRDPLSKKKSSQKGVVQAPVLQQ